MSSFDDSLQPILGKKSADALAAALDLHTVGDLLRHYPRRYEEFGKLTDIAGLEIGEHVTIQAEITRVTKHQMRQRHGTRTEVEITDGKHKLTMSFFNQLGKYRDQLKVGAQGFFAGKVGTFNKKLQLQNPEVQIFDEDDDQELQKMRPVYPAAAKMPTWKVANCVRQLLGVWDGAEDPLPPDLRNGRGMLPLDAALRAIHMPDGWEHVSAARKRLKWDEAIAVQLALALRRQATAARPAPACPPKPGGILDAFDARLPFELTAGQQEVGEAIATDLTSRHPMNRLLQGEVGSGKTIVALRAMLQVVDSGRQAAMLAPTEVLAAQHARSLQEMLGDLAQAGELGAAEHSTRLTLLTGSLPAAARKQALLDAASGAAGIVVGTHALIQDKVSFADLGFVVVDEQHRFGVEQRDALRTRAADGSSPHVLVMTATPIPRTVAMTVYGDLETSALRELPRGRSPIATNVVPVAEKPQWLERVWQRVREEVASGHQAYVVCPRIGEAGAEETEEPPLNDDGRRQPLAVEEVAPMLASGPLKGLRIAVLHGKMPADDKDATMRAFAAAEIDVLVATTVVEVGVNVPNATAMVIMDADRFGVSQLHQLRGRVGRGSAPGLCLLVSEALDGTTTRERLDAVASTLDGFELAQLDLEIRREGDILGASQSGKRSQLKMLSLLRDSEVISQAREVALQLVSDDPGLGRSPGLRGMAETLVDSERAEFLQKA
ncbi:ATP-dependent DNA helicase RecG [Kibdelosporangium phytohabitans]|uniref:ATP-dependent DNA helicase RecG n=1 Tax=Kibdelosporangium phytohabitans TaxID=860235 RepID=A0A0N9I330_9PSEU|nr:ATP-dependent DNA helicase RecG [Kibdelosporangium phytohabitans]ALG13098.1 ATP-dependent DNA helicase RecG [Kibdelosporangium phytohabitans]MBE1464838.1 ATP-dependent DNA helicase RecG [Kibdelosporangium phytohabitans]